MAAHVVEPTEAGALAAEQRVHGSLDREVDRGRLTSPQAQEALERVVSGMEIDRLDDADLVIETVPERLALKQDTLRQIDAVVVADALIASNTSSIPLAQLAAATANPQRGAGHLMGPLRLCDLIGLDVLFAIGDSLCEEFKRLEYASSPMLKRMVASGRLGRKTGRGFHDYSAMAGVRV